MIRVIFEHTSPGVAGAECGGCGGDVCLESLCEKVQNPVIKEEMASPVDLLGRYANWKGSSEVGRQDFMCSMTSFSKHFIVIGVSATGQ